MKKIAIYGAATAIGMSMMLVAVLDKPFISFEALALIVGTGIVVWGITSFVKEVQ